MSKRLLRLVGRMRGRSSDELSERAGQAFAAFAERRQWRDHGEPSDEVLRSRLIPNLRAVGLDSVFASIRERARPRLTPGLEDPRGTARLLRQRWPQQADALRARADEIVAGRFRLLGYEPTLAPGAIDWSADAVSGVRAPAAHWSRISYLDAEVAGDHKLVWELNRHQFLVTLGQAYVLTDDERYARRAVELLVSWMDANPPKQGVNWASSLEVAYRAIAWLWTIRLIRRSQALTREVLLRWLKFLDLSGRHIERYLSTYFSPNTHLTGEALGLLYLGTQLPELRTARRWRDLGWRILQGQLDHHVLPDGTYYEQSSWYHRYTLDIYLHARLLGAAHRLPAAGVQRIDLALGGLAEQLVWLSRPDGTMPLFGDDDGGRLLFLDGRPGDDPRSTLAAVATILARGDLATAGDPAGEELLWLVGEAGLRAFESLPRSSPKTVARAFPDGGRFVVRDGWSVSSAVLSIDCGPLGADNSGHAHADTLAIELALGKQPVFVDAGTLSYTTSALVRDLMRSSAVHNTVTVDYQSSSEPDGPFRWRSMTAGVCDAWHETPFGVWFEGHHDGYLRLLSPARHGRAVLAARGAWWVIRDEIRGIGTHHAFATFQCAAGLECHVEGDTLRVDNADGPVVAITAFSSSGAWELDSGVVSRCYGATDGAPRARYAFRTECSTAATFVVQRGSQPPVQIEGVQEGGRVLRMHQSGNEDLIVFDGGDGRHGVRTDARMAWVRHRETDGALAHAMLVGGTILEVGGRRIIEHAGGVSWQADVIVPGVDGEHRAAPIEPVELLASRHS